MSFAKLKHEEYCLNLEKTKDLEAIGFYLREHLKLAGGYWCLTALACLKTELEPKK